MLMKDKNFLVYVHATNNRSYRFDINKGMFFSDATGKPLKAFPAGFKTALQETFNCENRVVEFLSDMIFTGRRSLADFADLAIHLTVCDKLDSIGYDHFMNREEMIYLPVLDEKFKKFSHKWREDPGYRIRDFIFDETLENAGVNIENPAIMTWIKNYYNNFSIEEIKLIAYYLVHGVYDYCVSFSSFTEPTVSMFRNFFDYSKRLGIQPKKEDFFRQSINLSRMYQMRKKEIDQQRIEEQYAKHEKAFHFETDLYQVTVPNNAHDFEEEGKNQHNCVCSIYLNRVINGATNVVFVRKKDNPNKSYITCEISNDGNIKQFLLKYNSDNISAEDNEFREMYAKHIKANW